MDSSPGQLPWQLILPSGEYSQAGEQRGVPLGPESDMPRVLSRTLTPLGTDQDMAFPVQGTLTPLPMSSPRASGMRDMAFSPLHVSRNSRSDEEPPQELAFYLQATLMFLVIALGCVDIILRQIVAKTLSRFSYMLSLATATAYLPIYWGVLWTLIKLGMVSTEQVQWVWAGWRNTLASIKLGLFSAPYLKLFAVAALGDAIGNGLGYICTPYVSGPVHSLLAQFTIMFTAMLSMCLLRKRYSLAQICGLLGVELAVLVGVLPSFEKGQGDNSTDPFFAFLLGCSCAFNAMAWIMKEKAFRLYKCDSEDANYQVLEPLCFSPGSPDRVTTGSHTQLAPSATTEANISRLDSLHIFVVNSHVALFQWPLTLLLVPLAQATGQTNGENVFSYVLEGLDCLSGSVEQGALCSASAKFTVYYVICNIFWNWAILLNVKFNGALSTFVALKAISPCSAVLFAYVDWPLLHTTPVKPLTWAVFLLIMPFIMFYVWASKQQQRREETQPPSASCCWPLWTNVAR